MGILFPVPGVLGIIAAIIYTVVIISTYEDGNKTNVDLKTTYFILVKLMRKCHSYTSVLFLFSWWSSSSYSFLNILKLFFLYISFSFSSFLLFYTILIKVSILYPLD